jgi:hypothetical protein
LRVTRTHISAQLKKLIYKKNPFLPNRLPHHHLPHTPPPPPKRLSIATASPSPKRASLSPNGKGVDDQQGCMPPTVGLAIVLLGREHKYNGRSKAICRRGETHIHRCQYGRAFAAVLANKGSRIVWASLSRRWLTLEDQANIFLPNDIAARTDPRHAEVAGGGPGRQSRSGARRWCARLDRELVGKVKERPRRQHTGAWRVESRQEWREQVQHLPLASRSEGQDDLLFSNTRYVGFLNKCHVRPGPP